MRGVSFFLPLVLAILICGSEVRPVRADGVLLLTEADLAAKVRLGLIRSAKKEILLSSYIFKNDLVGMQVLSELEEAARRGVQVTLVLDAFTNKLPLELIARIQQSGVRVYNYHPIKLLRPSWWFRRMHDKLLAVDGEHIVVGDRNHGAEYFGGTNKPRISKEIYVRGGDAPVKASAYFRELVRSGEVESIRTDRVPSEAVTRAGSELLQHRTVHPLNPAVVPDAWKTGILEGRKAFFYHDSILSKGKVVGVEEVILDGIRRAKSKIVIENAYVILTEKFRVALREAAARGVTIEVVTNSFAATNQKLVGAAWEESKRFLAEIGADVWEHPGTGAEADLELRNILGGSESMIHAKTMAVDGKETFIMTFNKDPRSEKLNLEMLVHVPDDKVLTRQLIEKIEAEKKEFGYIRTLYSGAVTANAGKCGFLYRAFAAMLKPQL